jgi:hypothetical protein
MSGRIGGLAGRNPTSQSLRRGQLYGLPQPRGQGAPKHSDGGRSGESRICEPDANGSAEGAKRSEI